MLVPYCPAVMLPYREQFIECWFTNNKKNYEKKADEKCDKKFNDP